MAVDEALSFRKLHHEIVSFLTHLKVSTEKFTDSEVWTKSLKYIIDTCIECPIFLRTNKRSGIKYDEMLDSAQGNKDLVVISFTFDVPYPTYSSKTSGETFTNDITKANWTLKCTEETEGGKGITISGNLPF